MGVAGMVYPGADGTELVLAQICTETFPTQLHKHGFTFVILAAQYVMPLLVLPIVHANILLFLRYVVYHSFYNVGGFQIPLVCNW